MTDFAQTNDKMATYLATGGSVMGAPKFSKRLILREIVEVVFLGVCNSLQFVQFEIEAEIMKLGLARHIPGLRVGAGCAALHCWYLRC